MKKQYFLALLVMTFCFSLSAQNAIVGTGFSTGWGGGFCAPGSSNFTYLGEGAGTSYVATLAPNGTGDQYFRFGVDWGGTTSQLTINPGSDDLLSAETEYNLNGSCTTSGAMYFNVASTSHRYVFKTVDAGTSPTGTFIVFLVEGDVRTVSSVSNETPLAGSATTVTATLDDTKSAGQGVYLRYSTDGFTNSTIVEMSDAGSNNFTADIPAQTANTNVSYYIFTSGDGLTISHADADFYTINLNNNSTNNYSFNVLSDTSTTGDWSQTGTWVNGTIPDSDYNVNLSHSVTLDQDDTIASLVFQSGGELTVQNGNTLTITGNLDTANGSITIESGGALIVQGTSSGNITYQRNLATENWYLVSSPVNGETYDNAYVAANNLAINGTNNAIGSYTTGTDTWSYMQTGGGATFTSGRGYSVRKSAGNGNSNISFTGTINTSDVQIALATGGNGAFNLLGNPFTSYVNSGTLLPANTSNLVSQTLWVWNQGTSNYETKVTVDAFILAPGQGFFVSAANTNNFTFAASNQQDNTDTFQRSSRPEIHLLMTDGTSDRFTKVYYIAGTTTGFDNGYDGEAFGGQTNSIDVFTHLVSDSQGKNFQVQSLPDSNFENMIVPVGVRSPAGSVTFSVDDMNLPSGYKVFLEDKDTGNFTRLDEEGSEYKVTFDSAVNGIGRFFLHMTTNALSTSTVDLAHISAYMSAPNFLRVVGVQQGTAKVRMFNMLGKQVVDTSFQASGSDNVPIPNLQQGVYIVQISTEQGMINKKIVIE